MMVGLKDIAMNNAKIRYHNKISYFIEVIFYEIIYHTVGKYNINVFIVSQL